MRMSKADRVAHAAEATGLGSLARRFGSWKGVLALTYHRVGLPDQSYHAASWDATPAMFEEQVRGHQPAEPEADATQYKQGRSEYVRAGGGTPPPGATPIE